MILASVKDMGGINNVLPVVLELQKRNYEVEMVVSKSGIAIESAEKHGLKFTAVDHAGQVAEKFFEPELLITSMCFNHSVGKDLVRFYRGNCPTVAIQDYWGVRLTDEWGETACRPDFITVNDKLGADLVTKAWPEFPKNNILQTGFPMFDSYYDLTPAQQIGARKNILDKLGKEPETLIIFFPCGALDGAGSFLTDLLAELDYVCWKNEPLNCVLIPRCHPKLKREAAAKREMKIWNKAITKFEKYRPGIIVTDEGIIRDDMKKLLLSADIVVSDYSTALLEAGLVGAKLNGKPNISACYIPEISRDMARDLGPLLKEPPFVTLGCTKKAGHCNEMGPLIHAMINNQNSINEELEEKQKEFLKTDGQNAKRVVEFLETLL